MRRFFPLLLLLPLALAACGGGAKAAGCEAGTTADVTVQVLPVPDPLTVGKYEPNPVTVTAGKAVRWDFKDAGNAHSVTADDNSFDSQLLDAGKSCTITLKKAGTVKYHCSIHAPMVGTVEVK
jgi:plastocyanin